jgi:hypothetical protein
MLKMTCVGLRATKQDASDGHPAEGGDEDQPVAVGAGQRDLGAGGRQVHPHPVQELQAHQAAPGLLGGQLQDCYGEFQTR